MPLPDQAGRVLLVSESLQVPMSEFTFTFARSSGPGGQNVNKVSSKAVLHWQVRRTKALPQETRDRFLAMYAARISREGELVLASQRFRDQGRNVSDCLVKLQSMLQAAASPPKPRRATRPTRGSVEERLRAKRSQAARKRGRKRAVAEQE
jgi:ribosome-associated protein